MQAKLTDVLPVSGLESRAAGPTWHTLSVEQALGAARVDAECGLSSAEAAARAGQSGPNRLVATRAEPRWYAFIRQYYDPMQIVLLVAGVLSLYPLKQLGAGSLLILLTLVNAVLGLQQEGKAETAVAALQDLMIVTARVRRDGKQAEIPAERLVPGDVVSIEAGDIVPADGRLLREAMLEVAESELTGESLPVRLVDVLQRKGQVVAMTGDGVNDAPALKKADIGIAMGETGTEVAKRAAVMVLTDDNFSTITKAVELGRGLYDNLARYIRFEMGCMFGFIITFLGASIFDIAHGEPLLPLQVLWVAFTTVTIQSVGLGYSNPAERLMERRPRPPSQPILSGGVLSWLVSAGLVMAIGTLNVVSWAQQAHTLASARTMGLVVFSLFNLFFSISAKDERESVFSLSTFADRTCIVTTGGSLVLIVMATVLVPCQVILKTTRLDEGQWLLCAAIALLIIALSEIRKAVLRRTASFPL